jgi:hypothetical protein
MLRPGVRAQAFCLWTFVTGLGLDIGEDLHGSGSGVALYTCETGRRGSCCAGQAPRGSVCLHSENDGHRPPCWARHRRARRALTREPRQQGATPNIRAHRGRSPRRCRGTASSGCPAGRPARGALIRLMLATGLRRGEALALRWSDVDLDGRALRVRWPLSRTSAGLVLGEPKTEKSRRVVPLPQSAVMTLDAHRERQAQERLTAADYWLDHDLVCTTEIATPWTPGNVLRRFQLLAVRSGLAGVHLHTLRHTAASLLLAPGTPTPRSCTSTSGTPPTPSTATSRPCSSEKPLTGWTRRFPGESGPWRDAVAVLTNSGAPSWRTKPH